MSHFFLSFGAVLRMADCRVRFTLKLVLQCVSILSILIGTLLFFRLGLHTDVRIQVHLNFFLSSLLTSIFSILFSFLVLERCHNKDDLLERKFVLSLY